VYDGLRQEIPEELLAFIESVGVTNQSDRIGVAQIIISIESWFNKFDRVLKDAEEQITAELRATFVPGARRALTAKKSRSDEVNEGDNVFGPPSLRLVSPVDILKRTEALQAVKTIRMQAGAVSHREPARITYAEPGDVAAQGEATGDQPTPTSPLIVRTIGWFKRLEGALEGVERAATRGLTNARFGLGPSDSDGFGFEHPKSGHGFEHPKSGHGFEHPKSGHGFEHPKSGHGNGARDPNGSQESASDGAGLDEVAALYSQVADAMQQLEQDVSDLESAAAAALTVEGMGEGLDGRSRFEVISREICRSFGILKEAAANARRTVRQVLANPVYGLGPGPVPFGLDAREEMAVKSGLGRRNLQLLP
jgi:hypothetical protein